MAKRIKIDIQSYLNLIENNYYVDAKQAIEKNMADRIVEVTCSKELIKNNKCPLYFNEEN